jgi:L-threonylcarbamoyladenylate synthase
LTSDLTDAVEAVRSGLIVGLPTDTVYGVGVDPTDLDAVSGLFELKGRPAHKPVGLLAASLEQAASVGVIRGAAAELAARHWPGALTLIVRPKVVLSDWAGDQQQTTVGIRVPDHPVARELLEAAGPMSVTSANHSGEPEAMNDVQARRIFGDAVAVYLPGESPGGEASTVVDVTGTEIVVLRQGPVFL